MPIFMVPRYIELVHEIPKLPNEKVDKERQRWIQFLFEVDWDDPYLYDIVLNLSRTSLATACYGLSNS